MVLFCLGWGWTNIYILIVAQGQAVLAADETEAVAQFNHKVFQARQQTFFQIPFVLQVVQYPKIPGCSGF